MPPRGIRWQHFLSSVLCWLTSCHFGCFGWVTTMPSMTARASRRNGVWRQTMQSFHSRIRVTMKDTMRSSTMLFSSALPEGYQEYGQQVIRKAGSLCGIVNDEDLTIDWKADRIVVTVHGKVYVSTDDEDPVEEDAEDAEEADSQDDVDEEDDELASIATMSLDDEISSSLPPTSSQGVDVTVLARAINAALDDGGIGLAIAESHEIEVTTPGASDELLEPVMFAVYKGFEVICEQLDLKTKEVTKIEGRLVERNDEFTIVNIKGRMKKMKNSTLLSVKLPKAKKEKGVK